jgi:exodeoxyribonuclease VII small subunit
MPRSKKHPDFEQSLGQLETLVNQMEQGDLSLEQALGAFEEGVRLTRECQEILDQAEQKVQMLIERDGTLHTQPFSADEDA